jgi:hypothetical protein
MAGTTEGAGGMTASVAYAESPTPASAANQTTNIVAATADVKVGPDLPTTLALNSKQKLTFTFKNTSPFTLTNVTGNMTSVTPTGATYVPSGCQAVTVQPQQTCVYTGDYSSSVAGAGQVNVTFTFDQSPGSKSATSAVTTLERQVIYVGTEGSGLWESEDGGQNFTQIATTTIGSNNVNALTASGTSIFAGASNGLFSSTDGITFNKISDLKAVGLATLGSSLFVALNNSRSLYRSSDMLNFNEILSLSSLFGNITALAASGSTVFAGTSNTDLFTSTDGQNFSSKSIFVLSSDGINAIAASGSNVYLGLQNAGLRKSTDNGNSFASTSFSGGDFGATATLGMTTYTFNKRGAILYRSIDGTNFNQVNIGSVFVRTLAISRWSTVYAGVDSRGLYASTNGTDFNQLASTSLGTRTIYSIVTN